MKRKVIVCDWSKYYHQIHPYDVKTIGKHPIRAVEGGSYLTEDEGEFDPCSDMGWFFLNKKEYEFFKSHLEEIEIEIK